MKGGNDCKGTKDFSVQLGMGDKQDCAKTCNGYKFFARQSGNKCWCGDTYGKAGYVAGCKCSGKIQSCHSCVYKLPELTLMRGIIELTGNGTKTPEIQKPKKHKKIKKVVKTMKKLKGQIKQIKKLKRKAKKALQPPKLKVNKTATTNTTQQLAEKLKLKTGEKFRKLQAKKFKKMKAKKSTQERAMAVKKAMKAALKTPKSKSKPHSKTTKKSRVPMPQSNMPGAGPAA